MEHTRSIPIILILLFVIGALVIPANVSALAMYSGNQVSINDPVNDDVFAAGGMIDVNAPVDSLTVVGGTVRVNAPVKGDIIAAGGNIIVNNNVGGKLVAAGGTIDVNGDIGTNAVITGGSVNLNSRSTVGKDAAISAGSVTTSGHVLGNLHVKSQNYQNSGTVGGTTTYVQNDRKGINALIGILGILFSIGWLILGLILIKIAPGRFHTVEAELEKSPVIKLVVGFFGLIVLCVVLILLAISVIGLPTALTAGLLMLIGVIFSVLFVSSSFGRLILKWLKFEAREWQVFVLGFIILNILFRIPVVGIIILVISISLGFGALLFAVYNNRNEICV